MRALPRRKTKSGARLMAIKTQIEWCDSSINAQMGCDGCELWNPKRNVRSCYAGTLTERYAGQKGWPLAFDQPAMFPERIKQACKWSDLTGTERPDKPWLNGMPRVIFLDDMGDTFTEGLPVDWLSEHIPAMEASPHIWMFLTKRPRRMRQSFDQLGYVPANFRLGASLTTQSTFNRALALVEIENAFLWISAEPLWSELNLALVLPALSHVIAGGESGGQALPCHPNWARWLRDQCQGAGVPFFWKQWGEWEPFTRQSKGGYVAATNGRKVETKEVMSCGHFIENDDGWLKVGKKKSGRLLDGRTWDEFPVAQVIERA
jgi:protein gp37